MNPLLVSIFNPHFPDKNYSVTDITSDVDIWRIYININNIDFMREVVIQGNSFTEISVGGRCFRIDCTLQALLQLLSEQDDCYIIKRKKCRLLRKLISNLAKTK